MVLLVHGFPESWYSWRHQLTALAAAGYRTVAIDVRGYGRSSAPVEVEAYGMLQHVSDNLGVLEALGEDKATIVGHDWGSIIAAHCALLRPDVFTGLAMLSSPYAPPGTIRPTDAMRAAGGDEEFYIMYFQAPGRAEAEAEMDVRHWMLGILMAVSGDAVATPDGGAVTTVPAGQMLRDRFVIPDRLPGWLTETDLDFYVEEFERTGFRGGLNRYRNMDLDWEDLQPWRGQPITVPSLFIGGQRDPSTRGGQRAIAKFGESLPGLRGNHLLAGCGHWVQQERPEEVNRLLIDWLNALP